MFAVKLGIYLVVYLNLIQSIISEEPNKYCQLNGECEMESHIGCHHSSLRSSGFEIEHLRYSDRLSILNQINQFRSDVAVGTPKFRVNPIPNMNKIFWNYELEKFLKLSIRKVSNQRFPCVLTSKSDQISQFVFNMNKPKESFANEVTFNDSLSDIINRAIHNYRTASTDDVISYSFLFNPNTTTMGCAIGSKIQSSPPNLIKSLLIRCAFIGTKIDKKAFDNYEGWPCSDCGPSIMNCDEFFPGLCVPGILKGEKGQFGHYGDDGYPGQKGYKGDMGVPGYDGFNGLHGLKGPKGENGEKGSSGTEGSFDIKGEKGEPGKVVHGEPGSPGHHGFPGLRGLPGPKGQLGLPGLKGISNHMKGEMGDNGIGIPGEKGLKGNKGLIGNSGSPGLIGSEGLKGISLVIKKEELLEGCNECPIGPPGQPGPPGRKGQKGLSISKKQY